MKLNQLKINKIQINVYQETRKYLLILMSILKLNWKITCSSRICQAVIMTDNSVMFVIVPEF